MGIVGRGGGGIPAAGMSERPCGEEPPRGGSRRRRVEEPAQSCSFIKL